MNHSIAFIFVGNRRQLGEFWEATRSYKEDYRDLPKLEPIPADEISELEGHLSALEELKKEFTMN